MAEKSRYWSPTRTYEFEVKIGKLDLTPDLYKLSILTSIQVPYQTVILDLFLDPSDVIIQELYGQTPINLTARYIGDVSQNFALERVKMELLPITTEIDIPMYDAAGPQVKAVGYKERKPFTVTAVSRYPYRIMNTLVNDVFYGNDIFTVINSLVSNTLSQTTLNYDVNDRNTEVLDQLLVPPTTLFQALKYLNRTVGIFNGIPAIYCSSDTTQPQNSIINIKNLTRKITSSHKFTVWQLATGIDNSEIIKKSGDGKVYYTLNPLKTTYSGSSTFAAIAPTVRYIAKPKDTLFTQFDIDLETFAKKYGIISKTDKIFFDKADIDPKTRILYSKDHTGNDASQAYINSNLSKAISELSTVTLGIEQNLMLFNLMEVGEAVQLNSKMTTVSDLTGKYILKASTLDFVKSRDWESSARLYLIRTNKTIN
jgi:hypothetical protein